MRGSNPQAKTEIAIVALSHDFNTGRETLDYGAGDVLWISIVGAGTDAGPQGLVDNLVVVPEPSAAVLLGAFRCLGLLYRRRA